MKTAVIDIGSNSIRLLLGTYEGKQWYNEGKRLWTTRLGDRESGGELKDTVMNASYEVFSEISELMASYGVERSIAIATSAVREASNGGEFLERAKQYCPTEYRILSGDEEAFYGFKGALQDRLSSGMHYGIIDIGGGSTELAVGSKDGVYWSRSYPVGAVRLQSLSESGPQSIWEETRFLWDPMMIEGNFGDFVGIGGTITTLAAIDLKMITYVPEQIQNHKLTREAIEGMIMSLRYMSREERLQVPGLQPGRVDIIVSGAEILTSCMDAYEIPYIFVSEQDGMEAIQQELLEG
ncbi:phosphatase [Veillonella agrestimuris]|uniref:Ppx/GppA phosphatase family protein n=1 Tax=Veillonella agrestimuris TaxID=2941340 RepID=UPI00203A6583|nr:phosphatase [Veillonella agrestimuris]